MQLTLAKAALALSIFWPSWNAIGRLDSMGTVQRSRSAARSPDTCSKVKAGTSQGTSLSRPMSHAGTDQGST